MDFEFPNTILRHISYVKTIITNFILNIQRIVCMCEDKNQLPHVCNAIFAPLDAVYTGETFFIRPVSWTVKLGFLQHIGKTNPVLFTLYFMKCGFIKPGLSTKKTRFLETGFTWNMESSHSLGVPGNYFRVVSWGSVHAGESDLMNCICLIMYTEVTFSSILKDSNDTDAFV